MKILKTKTIIFSSKSSTSQEPELTELSQDTAQSIYGGDESAALNPENGAWSTALQNLLDRPPASLPQRLIGVGTLFCIAIGAWAWFGQVEEVGKAQGKLVPQGETYKVEPVTPGKITEVLVEEGETVTAGQVLAQLDPERAEGEINRLEQMLLAYNVELQQKQSLLKQIRLKASIWEQIANAEIQAQESAIAIVTQKAQTTRQLLTAYQLDMAAHQERLDRLNPLKEVGAISQEFIFQAQQSLQDSNLNTLRTQGDLATTIKETERLQAELAQKQAQKSKTQLEAQQQIQQLEVEITQLQGKIADTQSLIKSAQTELQQSFLKSPTAGMILSLELQNTGEVVEPGQTVAEIAPQDSPLVLSAVIPSQEAGFITEGMPVKVKFDAYPYQDYGVVSGEVSSISANAKTDEKLGTFYQIEVALKRDYITQNDAKIQLKLGQTAQADIIIRQRRIADVIFDPIKQLQKGGMSL
jgi:hemolysin D